MANWPILETTIKAGALKTRASSRAVTGRKGPFLGDVIVAIERF